MPSISDFRRAYDISDEHWLDMKKKARKSFVKLECQQWCRIGQGWQGVPEEIQAKAYELVHFYLKFAL